MEPCINGGALALGAIFAGMALLVDGVWAIAAGAARDWFGISAARLRQLRRTGGVVMIVLDTMNRKAGRGHYARAPSWKVTAVGVAPTRGGA